MSQSLTSRSHDLKKLRNEGYNLVVRGGHLVVKDVPYVTAKSDIERGALVMALTLAGDVTASPADHVTFFAGGYPCYADGKEIAEIKNQSGRRVLSDGLEVDHMFSAKPKPRGRYEDYYTKVTTYVAIISGPAKDIDPAVTAKTFPAIEGTAEKTVFQYVDTASSRSGIESITDKLAMDRVAIVGVGGTGAYVLDFLAKTPVKEIHLFDGDAFLQHNAFRAPGAPSLEELKKRPQKTAYLSRKPLFQHAPRNNFARYLR